MILADLLTQIAPPETRSPSEILAVARHEAGHAYAIEALPRLGRVTSVSMIAKGSFAARTSSKLRDTTTMTADELDNLIVSCLAGRAADDHWGRVSSGSAGGPLSDLAHATALAAGKHASWGLGKSLLYRGDNPETLLTIDPSFRQTVESDLARLYAIAKDLISANADTVDRIARRLAERSIISGAEVRAIIGRPAAGTDEVPTDGGPHE